MFYNGDELGTGKAAVLAKLREEIDVLLNIEQDIRLALQQGSTVQNGSDNSNGGSENDSAKTDD